MSFRNILHKFLGIIYLPSYLAWADIRQRYRRSYLGPFWITLSTAIMIGCMGLIFSQIFKAQLRDFLPYLCAGLITWSLIASIINGSTVAYTSHEAMIKQLPLPIITHNLQLCFREVYIFFHNILIYPVVCLIVGKALNFNLIFIIPGLTIVFLNLLWMSVIVGIISTRFRDISQIVSSIITVVFYITPIFWMPHMLPGREAMFILGPNPFYHFIQVVREPLLGRLPSLTNWIICICLCLFGWVLAYIFLKKYENRIVYWL